MAGDDDIDESPDPTPDARQTGAVTVREYEDGLRFVHIMAMQSRLALEKVEAQLAAVTKVLQESGTVDEAKVVSRLVEERQDARSRLSHEAHVSVGPAQNKFELQEPDVDCASLLHLCKGRCCRLTFALTFQDLDEGVVKWDYAHPYRIRQRESDGYCVHNSAQHTCSVYQHRPGVCRVYDCRHDQRVWIDFENKIPAPLEAVRDQPVVVERIGLKKPEPPPAAE